MRSAWFSGRTPRVAFLTSVQTGIREQLPGSTIRRHSRLPARTMSTGTMLPGNVVNDDLFVTNGDVTLRSLGGTVYSYTLNDDLTVGGDATLKIGDVNNGLDVTVGETLLIDDATLSVRRHSSLTAMGTTDIGSTDSASGFLNLQETAFDADGRLRAGLGAGSQGRIVAAAGTIANTTDVDIGFMSPGNGRLEVIGEDTVWNSTAELDIGQTGRGVMEIRLGGTVNSEVSAIGWQPDSDGEVTVRHTGSRWNIEQRLDIGASVNSFGKLLLEKGGSTSVFGTDVAIGTVTDLPDCEVTVRDHGSVLFVNANIFVGGNSTGVLNIENDGNALANGGIFIRPGSTVNVAGISTQGLTGDTMMLEGAMNLTDNGHVNIGNAMDIEASGLVATDGTGIPIVEANSISNMGTMSLNADTDVLGDTTNHGTIESAAFNIFYDDLVNSGSIHTALGTVTRITGATSGSGPFAGPGVVELLGPIRPGSNSGTNVAGNLSISGNFNMNFASVLEIEIGGAAASQFDRLTVGGNVGVFEPDLVVTSIGSFTPVIGDEFVIIEVGGSRLGEFDGLPQGALVTSLNGQDLFIDYTAGDGNDVALNTISIGGILLGDVNLDGSVDLLDVAPFVSLISTSTFQPEADINQDGSVDLLDVGPFVTLLVGG